MLIPPKFLHNPKSKLWLFVRPSQADSKMYTEIKMACNSQNKSETEQTWEALNDQILWLTTKPHKSRQCGTVVRMNICINRTHNRKSRNRPK